MVIFLYICFMKHIITIILITTNVVLFAQNLDSLTFNYINQYRVKKGKNVLIWSDELYRTSVKHSNNMILNDSMYHSLYDRTYSENVTYGSGNRGLVGDEKYKIFIKKYFNLNYEDVIKDLNIFIATNVVFTWYTSTTHNKIMLSMFSPDKVAAVSVITKDIVKKPNFIFGQEIFKGWGPYYYKLTLSATFQIK